MNGKQEGGLKMVKNLNEQGNYEECKPHSPTICLQPLVLREPLFSRCLNKIMFEKWINSTNIETEARIILPMFQSSVLSRY